MRAMLRAVARALIGGGGGGSIFIYLCSARLISFEKNLKTTDFKRNSSGRTRIYEYTPPPSSYGPGHAGKLSVFWDNMTQ